MPQQSKTTNPVRSTATSLVKLYAAFTGTGAASPAVSPVTEMSARDNFASPDQGNTTTLTRNGVGNHDFLFPTGPPNTTKIMYVDTNISGTPTMYAVPVTWSVTGGRLMVRVRTFDAVGTATDLTTGHVLRFSIDVDRSSS